MADQGFTAADRKHTGSCVCGSVQYSISGPPKSQYLCHCRRCQKGSGSAFQSNCLFVKGDFKVNKGEDSLRVYDHDDTASGQTLSRHFCGTCGTALFVLSNRRSDMIVIIGGTLDDYEQFQPQRESWTIGRTGWMKPIEGTECFETV